MLQTPHALLTFDKVQNPLRLPHEATSEPPKVVRTPSVFNILTSKSDHFWRFRCRKSARGCTFSTSEPPKVVRGPELVSCAFSLRNVLQATTAYTFSTSQLPKVVRSWCVLYILTWKSASRHNGVHFFDISTSKSGPRMVRFAHVHLQMRFAPQRRALFRHLNFQKCSETQVFCTF